MALIEISKMSKAYGNGFVALQDINLEIAEGSFTVILGPSGAGKSTLLRTLNGLDPASHGQVVVDGLKVEKSNFRALRAQIGMVFQQFNLVDRLNVMTNVLTGRLARRNPLLSLLYLFHREDYDLAQQSLTRVGLLDKAWNRADALSGGQQQRVGIARALTQQPKLILADEPVASLDPVTSREIMQLLKDISQEYGLTVVANLHQIDLAREYADRIVGLNAGQMVFDGTPEQLTETQIARLYGAAPVKAEPEETADALVLAYK